MILTLELTDEEAARLETLAKAHNEDVAQVAHDVLTDHLPQLPGNSHAALVDVMRRWDAEDAAAMSDPQNKLGLADWERLEHDLEAARLHLRVPDIT